jgi:hypothetical protein
MHARSPCETLLRKASKNSTAIFEALTSEAAIAANF